MQVWEAPLLDPPRQLAAMVQHPLGSHHGRSGPRFLLAHTSLFSLLLSPSWSVRRSEEQEGTNALTMTSKRWRRHVENALSDAWQC